MKSLWILRQLAELYSGLSDRQNSNTQDLPTTDNLVDPWTILENNHIRLQLEQWGLSGELIDFIYSDHYY